MSRLALAGQLLKSGQLDQAEAIYTGLLAEEPENVQAILAMAHLSELRADEQRTIAYLRKASLLQPDNVATCLRIARYHVAHEQFDLAEESYQRVLALRPKHIGTLIALANLHRQTEFSERIATMEELFARPDLSADDRRRLSFALGKVFDDLGEYDKAFGYFAEGNAIARHRYRYSAAAETRRFDATRTCFDADFFRAHAGAGSDDDGPIFIIGMPRSGTSLIEQILASHPDVYGAGEAVTLHRIIGQWAQASGERFPACVGSLDAAQCQRMAREYVDELRGRAGDKRFFTDKTLGSELYLGMIRVLLPKAKIIHCTRDPRDQGLSFFQRDFGDQQVFSYELEEIGRYYHRCRRIMAHWEQVLPGAIYRLRYEDIIENFEAGVRALLAHCGLPFDAACLAFHQTDRLIKTASHLQVRRPLYASSVGRWKRYERHLQPLFAALAE